MNVVDEALVGRHAALLPRYTSYPTANHFCSSVGPVDYRKWIAAIGRDAALSLYLHIPFCESLCWYCACSTKATSRYETVSEYLNALEAAIVSQLIPNRVATDTFALGRRLARYLVRRGHSPTWSLAQ